MALKILVAFAAENSTGCKAVFINGAFAIYVVGAGARGHLLSVFRGDVLEKVDQFRGGYV